MDLCFFSRFCYFNLKFANFLFEQGCFDCNRYDTFAFVTLDSYLFFNYKINSINCFGKSIAFMVT